MSSDCLIVFMVTREIGRIGMYRSMKSCMFVLSVIVVCNICLFKNGKVGVILMN